MESEHWYSVCFLMITLGISVVLDMTLDGSDVLLGLLVVSSVVVVRADDHNNEVIEINDISIVGMNCEMMWGVECVSGSQQG